MTTLRKSILAAAIGIGALLLCGCERPTETSPQTSTASETTQEYETASAQLWQAGAQAVEQSALAASELASITNSFLDTPSNELLLAAQQAWKKTLLAYGNFYFYSELSIIHPEAFQLIREQQLRIAGNPLQPGYLDAFGPYAYSGLVHDLSIEITPNNLVPQNGLTDEGDICLGLYAIEFMLYGQAQDRAVTDYQLPTSLTREQKETGFRTIEETPAFRRRQLLSAQTELLANDLKTLKTLVAPGGAIDATAWAPMQSSNQAAIIKNTLERSLTQILVSIIHQQKQQKELQDSHKNPETQKPLDPLDYHHNYTLTAADNAQLLANQLVSLTQAQGFVAKANVFDEIAAAQKSLTTFASNGGEPPWQTAYNQVKQAITQLGMQ